MKKETKPINPEEIPDWYIPMESKLIEAVGRLKDAQKAVDDLKAGIMQLMDGDSIKTVRTDFTLLTYQPPHDRTSVKTADLKEQYPEVFDELSYTIQTKPTLSIRLLK